MSPSAEEVQEKMAAKRKDDVVTAASYNQRVLSKKAKTEALKGKGQPVGGAPPLDPKKMKALANSMTPQPVFDDDPGPGQPPPQSSEPDRTKSPPMVPGVGSAYQVNQRMARGEIEEPVSMSEARRMAEQQATKDGKRRPLSQESIEALEAAQRQEQPAEPEAPSEDSQFEEELEQADSELEREVGDMFNYNDIQEQQRLLMSNERRERIEEDLEELTIADMIVRREIQQDIPIIPGKLLYRLRTFNQQEHLFCLQYVYDHPGSVVYTEEFLNTCKLVCALVALNNSLLPSHRDENGEISKKLFEKKMKHVASFPTQLIADLSVQAIWFNDRVTKLFSLDNLKNG